MDLWCTVTSEFDPTLARLMYILGFCTEVGMGVWQYVPADGLVPFASEVWGTHVVGTKF